MERPSHAVEVARVNGAIWSADPYAAQPESETSRYFGRKRHSTVLSAEDNAGEWLASGKISPLPHGKGTEEVALRWKRSRGGVRLTRE